MPQFISCKRISDTEPGSGFASSLVRYSLNYVSWRLRKTVIAD